MRVSEVVELLKASQERVLTPAEAKAVKTFLTQIAALPDMNISDLFNLLRRHHSNPTGASVSVSKPKTESPTTNDTSVVSQLRDAFEDDEAFRTALDSVASDKRVTKPMLVSAFMVLFDRTGGVPSRATRAELLQLIADERNISVRDKKAGAMLGRKTAKA